MIKKALNLAIFITFSFLPISTQAAVKVFIIDPTTAEATFKGHYFGLTSFNGQFHDINGTIISDPENPDNDRVQISINTCSVDMNDKALSLKVKSAAFLDCANFPKIMFLSTMAQWRQGTETKVKIQGLLTMHGITKEIRLNTILDKEGLSNGEVFNFKGEVSLNRLDFGVGSSFSVIDDEISISFNVSAFEDGTQTAELRQEHTVEVQWTP